MKADVAMTLASRGEFPLDNGRSDLALEAVRLMWSSDAFFAMSLYRAKADLQRRGVPFLPRLLHHAAMAVGQVCIGDPALIHPGVYVPHGQIVVDGFTEVGSGSRLLPWTTVGLKSGNLIGPTLGENVLLGTGARILGPVTVGDGAQVGANAVVTADVPSKQIVIGVPARELFRGADPSVSSQDSV